MPGVKIQGGPHLSNRLDNGSGFGYDVLNVDSSGTGYAAVSLRAVSVSSLFLMAGCFGHCGPTLNALDFQAIFPGSLTEANRTIARDALVSMGFSASGSGSGGFNMVKETVRVFVGNRTEADGATTTWDYRQDLPNREYGSLEETRSEAEALAVRTYWSEFNATLSEFESLSGWTSSGMPTLDPSIYIC